MKLGLITDIHEHVEHLQSALDRFQNDGVDQIVVVGDLVETGARMEETCQLLAEANVVGVWGNHDIGLCVKPSAELRDRYSDVVLRYMSTLQPRLTIGECHFTHVEPWLNPEDVLDLWYFEGPPDEHGKLSRIFRPFHRVMFVGHYHKWLVATSDGISDWSGDSPIRLIGQRYFVILDALCQGCFATFDTETSELLPLQA